MEKSPKLAKENIIDKARRALCFCPSDVRPYSEVYGRELGSYELYDLLDEALQRIQEAQGNLYPYPSLQAILTQLEKMGNEERQAKKEDML